MNKTEQQLADELESLISGKLGQHPAKPADDVAVLANLANQLVGLAQVTEAEADFVAALEAQLTRNASRRPTPKVQQPETQGFGQFVKEFFIMKRPIFAIGTVAIVAVVAYFAWTMFRATAPGSVEPAAVADIAPTAVVGEEIAAVVPTSDPTTLPKLPSLSGAAGVSMGMGGGGGGARPQSGGGAEAASDIAIDPMPVDGGFPEWNPLGETNFVLNTTLPEGETAVTVYNQPGSKLLTLEDAVRLAELLGMPTTLYQEQYQPYTDENGTVWTLPPVYQTFDGLRNLSVREDGWYYYDQSAAPGYNYEPMPVDQAKPIAEAFLRDRGLLNFEYEIVAPWSTDLEFHRILDGRVVNYPEYMVSVNNNGQILSVSHNPLSNLSAIGNYPIQSAQAAWELLTSGEIDYNQITFFTTPGPNYVFPTPVPVPGIDEGLYKSWQNLPQNGGTVTIFPYPSVMTAVNNDAPPRIQVDQYRLIASDADLQAIVPYAGQQIRIVGTVNDMETTPTLTLQSWEPVVNNSFEYIWLEGSISRSGDTVTFNSNDGQSFVLPNPPADLPDGERVYFNGWRGLNENGQMVILGWQSLDRIVDIPPVTIDEPIVDMPYVEYKIGQATINSVDLIYIFSPVYDPETNETQFYLQPAWRFQGETDTNELISLFVQAVDPALVQLQTP